MPVATVNWRSLVIVYQLIAIGFLAGCTPRHAAKMGWLTYGTPRIASAPTPTTQAGQAVVQRDANTNALDIVSSPEWSRRRDGSAIPASYSFAFRFSSSAPLPVGTPELFIPALRTQHTAIRAIDFNESRTTLSLSVEVDRLGADLLMATVFSPRGIEGVARFPQGSTFAP